MVSPRQNRAERHPAKMHTSFVRKHAPESKNRFTNADFDLKCQGMSKKNTLTPVKGEGRTLVVLRVSRQSSTTKNQLFAMRRHIAAMVQPPVILDVTGSTWSKAIPQMTRLVEEIRAGKWREVHFWRVDRTGRDHEYDVDLWRLCESTGTLLWYVDDDLRSDREGDKLKFHKESLAAAEDRDRGRKKTCEGILRVRSEAASMGLPDPFRGRQKGARGKKTVALIPDILTLLAAGRKAYRIAIILHINRKIVADIRDMPIAQLIQLTGLPYLEPWQKP